MAFHWRADDGPTWNAGLVHVALRILGDPVQYCQETLYFCDFSGGGVWTPCHPSESAHDIHVDHRPSGSVDGSLVVYRVSKIT